MLWQKRRNPRPARWDESLRHAFHVSHLPRRKHTISRAPEAGAGARAARPGTPGPARRREHRDGPVRNRCPDSRLRRRRRRRGPVRRLPLRAVRGHSGRRRRRTRVHRAGARGVGLAARPDRDGHARRLRTGDQRVQGGRAARQRNPEDRPSQAVRPQGAHRRVGPADRHGFTVEDPGIVAVNEWHPDAGRRQQTLPIYGLLARRTG